MKYHTDTIMKERQLIKVKEQHGFLDGLDISIDGVDIPLFLNSLNIFAKSILLHVVLLSLLQL